MTKRIRVTVTQDDIDKGRRFIATSCPVALALKRATGDVYAVGRTWRERVDGSLWTKNGKVVKSFVEAFDMGWVVKPMYFYTEVQ